MLDAREETRSIWDKLKCGMEEKEYGRNLRVGND